MNLGGTVRGEVVERLLRQRRRAVLDAAGHPVLFAGDSREPPQRVEVDAHLGNRAVRHWHAAVARPGLDADLADRLDPRAQEFEVAVEIGAQLLLSGVRLPDLADLAADAYRDALGLQLADQARQGGGVLGIDALLLGHRRERQVDQGRAVDVDVQEAGANLRAKFGLLFDELGIAGTRDVVERHVTRVPVARPLPPSLGGGAAAGVTAGASVFEDDGSGE